MPTPSRVKKRPTRTTGRPRRIKSAGAPTSHNKIVQPEPAHNPVQPNPPPPIPNLSKIHPGHRSEYTHLWYQAHELADYVDGGHGSYEDRIKKLPELNRLVEKMKAIESLLLDKRTVNPGHVNPWDAMIRCPIGTKPAKPIPAATTDKDPGACPSCGERQWWRLNKPGSKWICGRCHPPAPGVDVVQMNNEAKDSI